MFPSKQAEMEYVVKHSGKSSSLGGDANDDAVVRMRGLPYGCTKEEIASFFLGKHFYFCLGFVMLHHSFFRFGNFA